MKKTSALKIVVAAFTASTLFACTQDVTDSLTVQTESGASVTKELPKYRTYEEALAVAQNAIGMLGESSTTRSGKPRTVNTSDVQYILNSSSTRSDDEPDTLMYVFNYEDNAGFAVVSANRATEELIAVTEQGNYVASEETGNGGFDLYMDMAEEYVLTAAEPLPSLDGDDDGMVQFAETKTETTWVITDWAGPYLTVQWGQNAPYNQFCINSYGSAISTGCVPTAIAQILSYYEHPSSIKLDFDDYNTTLALDWGIIKKHKHESCELCGARHDVIAKMIRQIGEEMKIDYHGSNSGSNKKWRIPLTFSKLGYDIESNQNYDFDEIIGSLSKQRLIYMTGLKPDSDKGHAWVIDGYRIIKNITTDYSRTMGSSIWEVIGQRSSTSRYNHINWGWDGDCNGFFSDGVFDTSQGYIYDGSSIKYRTYTDNLRIYTNIRKK